MLWKWIPGNKESVAYRKSRTVRPPLIQALTLDVGKNAAHSIVPILTIRVKAWEMTYVTDSVESVDRKDLGFHKER